MKEYLIMVIGLSILILTGCQKNESNNDMPSIQDPIEIDLDEVGVQHSVEHSQEITITEDIKMNLRYPMLKDVKGINTNITEFEVGILMVYECIENVVYGEETIHRIDMTNDDIAEFIDSFTTSQIESVMKREVHVLCFVKHKRWEKNVPASQTL